MRITTLITDAGRTPDFEIDRDARKRRATDDGTRTAFLQALLRKQNQRLIARPELAAPNGALRESSPRSAVEWLVDALARTHGDHAAWSEAGFICLAHSTIGADVFHAPAAHLKHALGARKALPFAIGQCQALAFLRGLQLAAASAERFGNAEPPTLLLSAIEKRREPLAMHFSPRTPISDGVAMTVLRADDGPGLALGATHFGSPLLVQADQGFDEILDNGHTEHAKTIASSLCKQLGDAGAVCCVGPNIGDGLVAQIADELTRQSGGRALPAKAGRHFFMAADAAMALQDADEANRDGLPILLWSLDDRLSVSTALLRGRLSESYRAEPHEWQRAAA